MTPRPMTTTFEPRLVSDSLRPCSAILPKTVKAASLMSVFSSIRLHKFSLTTTYSAWPPLETTLSPTWYALTPLPTFTTSPAELYPS